MPVPCSEDQDLFMGMKEVFNNNDVIFQKYKSDTWFLRSLHSSYSHREIWSQVMENSNQINLIPWLIR